MSEELKIMMALNTRMELPEKEKQQYRSMVKGYEGELEYDRWMTALETEHLVLNDLLLEVNGSVFQIDSLVIFQDMIYLFDVKNYEGDYYYEGEKLRTITGKEIKDPLLQLKRSESLLRQLLNTLGYSITLKAYVLFIHPEFALFQAPKDEPIILPTQLNRFMKKLHTIKSKLTARNTKLAEKLLTLHIPVSPMAREHVYEYEKLKKGVFCTECGAELVVHKRGSLNCPMCSRSESIETCILRSVQEFRLLFPERKITTTSIQEWGAFTISKKTIQRYLMKHFKMKSTKHWSYYE